MPPHPLHLLLSAVLIIFSLTQAAVASHKSAPLASSTVRLTSLQWPPYAGEQLQQQGAVVAVARAAFAAMGYQLKVDFYPWSRAVAQARDNDHYQGYFPEYYSPGIADEFLYSAALGNGPLGFAEQSQNKTNWQTLDDLASKRIGVVQDYVNTEAFDQRMNNGQLHTEAVLNDRSNLLKLINQRIDLAVIDPNVMNYLFKSDPQLHPHKSKVSFNARLLADKDLYICFNNNPQGEKMRDIFNQGLSRINHRAILKRYLMQSTQPESALLLPAPLSAP